MVSASIISPSVSVVNNPPANAGGTGDVGLIPGLESNPIGLESNPISSGGGNGNPLQYPCLGDPMDLPEEHGRLQ